MRRLLVLVVVLGAVLFAADRVGAAMAGREIGKRVAAEYNLSSTPGVSINGFPFLTQAVNGRYQDIDVHVGDWSRDKIAVRSLDVALNGVSAPTADVIRNNTDNFTAETATASAVVPYDVVKRFAPAGVQSISGTADSMQVIGTFNVEGLSVPATINVTVTPVGNGIAVTPISVKSTIGPSIPVSWLKNYLTFTVPLEKLPLGARLSRTQPTAAGLAVTATADNVQFSHLPEAVQQGAREQAGYR